MDDLVVTPRLTIPARDLAWHAVRASGPGGQNVNKVSSKIDLRFDLEGTDALHPDVKARLRTRAASRIDAEGKLIVIAQESRDQKKNLETAREKLAALVRAAMVVPKKRKPTRPTRASGERRLGEKKRRGDLKRARRTEGE